MTTPPSTTSINLARGACSGCSRSSARLYEIVRYQRDPKTILAAVAAPGARARQVAGRRRRRDDRRIGAIIEYLTGATAAARLVPAVGTPERLRYTYWLHFAEGSAMPPLLMKLVFDPSRPR